MSKRPLVRPVLACEEAKTGSGSTDLPMDGRGVGSLLPGPPPTRLDSSFLLLQQPVPRASRIVQLQNRVWLFARTARITPGVE